MGDLGNEDRLEQYWSLRDLRAELETRWTLTDTAGAHRRPGPLRPRRRDRRPRSASSRRSPTISARAATGCGSTCTGQLYMCLGQEDDADLRAVLRANPGDDAPLLAAIRAAIARKPQGPRLRLLPPDGRTARSRGT